MAKKRQGGGSAPQVRGDPAPRAQARPVDYDAIQSVAKAAKLYMVQPVGFSALQMTDSEVQSQKQLPFDEEIQYKASVVPSEKQDELLITVAFDYARARTGEIPIHVKGTFLVGYEVPETESSPISALALESFAEVNGVYNAWPFIRELIAACAARVGVPDVMLPLWHPPKALPPKGQSAKITHKRS